MAASRSRRAGARQTTLMLPIAVAAAIGTVILGPMLAIPPATGRGMGSGPYVLAASPSPSTTTSPRASASPGSPAPNPGPEAGTPPVLEQPQPITRPRLAPATRLALQGLLDRIRERYAVPGISVAIVLPDGATWSGVSGMADVDAKAPVTRSTSFAIASVSKTFTSALILALAEDGLIDLEAPVRTYLPDLKKVSVKVKVRHLLDHTSGLRDFFFHASIDRLLLSRPDRRSGDCRGVWRSEARSSRAGQAGSRQVQNLMTVDVGQMVLNILKAESINAVPLLPDKPTRPVVQVQEAGGAPNREANGHLNKPDLQIDVWHSSRALAWAQAAEVRDLLITSRNNVSELGVFVGARVTMPDWQPDPDFPVGNRPGPRYVLIASVTAHP